MKCLIDLSDFRYAERKTFREQFKCGFLKSGILTIYLEIDFSVELDGNVLSVEYFNFLLAQMFTFHVLQDQI